MGGAHMAIHVRQQRIEEHKEEEMMTPYSRQDLHEGWEFKIVRSATGAFKNPQTLQSMLEQEALVGWELVEKFDGNRVRLKRQTHTRRRDAALPTGLDPYRTRYGISEARLAVYIMAGVSLIASFVVLAVYLLNG